MRTRVLIAILAGLCLVQSAFAAEWVSLFDGRTLDGWVQKNGTAAYRVEEGTIVGKTTEGSPNSFLCTAKSYGDFELEFDVKCDPSLNSGVQIRSKTKDEAAVAATKGKNDLGRVYGPQVEIASGGEKGSVAGYVYGEATGRGWLTPDAKRTPHKHFKNDGWNQFRIVAKGNRIQTWINGQPVDDLVDEEAFKTHPSGFIGLQVHGIKKGTGPFEVRWKNIRIRELSSTK